MRVTTSEPRRGFLHVRAATPQHTPARSTGQMITVKIDWLRRNPHHPHRQPVKTPGPAQTRCNNFREVVGLGRPQPDNFPEVVSTLDGAVIGLTYGHYS